MRRLAWDAPNMDMALSTLLGSKPSPRQRPDFAALYDWFTDGDPGAEAAVFVNVPEHLVERLTGWVMWLNQTGFRVYAKPKIGDSDIDEELAAYAFADDGAEEIVLGSHDARAFADEAEAAAHRGAQVRVLGFRELAGRLAALDDVGFVDLADIPGLFEELPPRVTLVGLPPQGRWFEPAGSLPG